MTIRVERIFTIDAKPSEVWQFIADPANRAKTISVVERYEPLGTDSAMWHVRVPIPFVNRTIPVRTVEEERKKEQYVSFVGTSRALTVRGEHTLTPVPNGTKLSNQFTVDGKLPGVERYFERQLDAELDRLESALKRAVADH